MDDDVLVVGAGVSGLSFARQVQADGAHGVRVLEKSKGVGGRCATRRVEGQPIDHGVPLLHGGSGRFRAELDRLGSRATLLPDWPWSVRGEGVPCQPQAYRVHSTRVAVAEGVNALPKLLARDLDIRRETQVSALDVDGPLFRATTASGTESARTLVLTCPVDQSRALLSPLAARSDQVRSILRVLSGVYTVPSLTLLAGYELRDDVPWHIQLPGPESALHTVIHDSSKRPGPSTVLVIQARSSYSRPRLDSDPASWTTELLDATAALLGPWARTPKWVQPHRWRYARVQRGLELAHPMLATLPGGARLGLCGEAFHPEGGVEGAFLSGLALARRLSPQS